jgi:hypothetical protein
MLSKCANPACSKRFRYFHEGKLFRMAVVADPDERLGSGVKKTSWRNEFFWLCDDCKTELTLTFKVGTGVIPVPLAGATFAAAS